MSTNEVLIAHDRADIRLKIADLDSTTVLIEGNRDALLFLSRLLAAHAQASSCGFQMSQNGSGSRWLTRDSSKGLYIHCTDACHSPHQSE